MATVEKQWYAAYLGNLSPHFVNRNVDRHSLRHDPRGVNGGVCLLEGPVREWGGECVHDNVANVKHCLWKRNHQSEQEFVEETF